MFESIVLRKEESGRSISAGQIAEALLYYQKVHLILDNTSLIELIRQIGYDWLMVLFRRPDLTAVYCEEILCAKTDVVGLFEYHNCCAIRLAGHIDTQLEHPRKRLQFTLERNNFDKKRTKKFVKEFFDLVPIRKFSGNHFIEHGMPAYATKDILDTDYARKAVQKIVGLIPGGYDIPEDFEFYVESSGRGLKVSTDIKFDLISRQRKDIGIEDPFTVAHVLSFLQDTSADMILASFYSGDFVTSSLNSSVIQVRHRELLRRLEINKSELYQFHEVVLPDSPRLGDVIDSGERSIREFLILLEKSSKFKNWLGITNPDEGLVREYMRSNGAEGWINRLPAKTMRYLMTLALDVAHPAIGLAAGALDTFVVEKMFSGWKPNHFIDNRLEIFLNN